MLRLLAVLVLLSASGPALAASCGKAANMERVLADKYGEAPVAAGIANNGDTFAVYSNPSTGSFTVLMKSPDGLMACSIMSGEGLKVTPPTDASGKET